MMNDRDRLEAIQTAWKGLDLTRRLEQLLQPHLRPALDHLHRCLYSVESAESDPRQLELPFGDPGEGGD